MDSFLYLIKHFSIVYECVCHQVFVNAIAFKIVIKKFGNFAHFIILPNESQIQNQTKLVMYFYLQTKMWLKYSHKQAWASSLIFHWLKIVVSKTAKNDFIYSNGTANMHSVFWSETDDTNRRLVCQMLFKIEQPINQHIGCWNETVYWDESIILVSDFWRVEVLYTEVL